MTGEKRLPQLDARLSAAAGYVRPGHVAADIGCDHGKLTVDLLVSGRCPKVIAADLRPIPLSKAQENCRKAVCEDRAELRLGNGLEVLQPGEATDIVIAGMGAETIIEILQAAPWVCDPAIRLILVPATKHSILRRWLCQNGFGIEAESLCRAAGRYYSVLCAAYNGAPFEPSGKFCVVGLTPGQPGAAEYRRRQLMKIQKYRRGMQPGPWADWVDDLIRALEEDENG